MAHQHAAQHVHFHFQVVASGEAATIIRRQETPARPAIQDDK